MKIVGQIKLKLTLETLNKIKGIMNERFNGKRYVGAPMSEGLAQGKCDQGSHR